MKRLAAAEDDKRTIGEWYSRWDAHVRDVDFVPVRSMFAEDAVAFGTKQEMMTSQPQLEREQWRQVWPTIEDYRYDLATLEVVTSPDRLMAMGAVMFRSTGFHPDGAKFVRNGRCTCTFMRETIGAPWVCTHSHLSLTPGTPWTSHGKRTPKS